MNWTERTRFCFWQSDQWASKEPIGHWLTRTRA